MNFSVNQGEMYSVYDYKVQEAINFLQENQPQDQPYYVGFSGGKDSIVTLDLVKKSGVPYEAYFCCTRLEHQYMYKFIKENYPEVKWLWLEISCCRY